MHVQARIDSIYIPACVSDMIIFYDGPGEICSNDVQLTAVISADCG